MSSSRLTSSKYTKQRLDLDSEGEVPVTKADVVAGRGGLEARQAEPDIVRRTPLDAVGDAGRQIGGRLVHWQVTCNGLLLGDGVCAQPNNLKGQMRPDAPC